MGQIYSFLLALKGGHDQPAISWWCMPLRPLCLLCFIRLFCTFLYVVCCYAQFAVHVAYTIYQVLLDVTHAALLLSL